MIFTLEQLSFLKGFTIPRDVDNSARFELTNLAKAPPEIIEKLKTFDDLYLRNEDYHIFTNYELLEHAAEV